MDKTNDKYKTKLHDCSVQSLAGGANIKIK